MSTHTKTGIWAAAVFIGLAAVASWDATGVTPRVHQDAEGGSSISKVHGSINIRDGGRAGSLKTVNGSVEVGNEAEVERIKVVNGSVRIGKHAIIGGGVKSVNGSVSLADGTRAKGDVATVNGRIRLAPGTVVDGEVSTVNGRMTLSGAEVGSLTTTNGDVELEHGAIVLGDLVVEKPENEGWHFFGKDRPRVVIGEDCEVRGTLRFEQEVELVVADSAKIGEITGVEPERR